MTTEQALMYVAFYLLGGIALGGALMVATLRNVMHAALALMMSFVGVAGIYLLLEAEFVAVVQVLIYIGAISVLILFAIMLTRGLMSKTLPPGNGQWIAAAGLAVLLFAILFVIAVGTNWPLGQTLDTSNLIPKIGAELVTTYVLPFEVASLVLLAALIGAIVIARE